jgi:hypothetical protein
MNKGRRTQKVAASFHERPSEVIQKRSPRWSKKLPTRQRIRRALVRKASAVQSLRSGPRQNLW